MGMVQEEVSNATTTEDDFNRVAVWIGWQHAKHGQPGASSAQSASSLKSSSNNDSTNMV
jgi:hypothetical protein